MLLATQTPEPVGLCDRSRTRELIASMPPKASSVMRYCRKCDQMLPAAQFPKDRRARFICHTHFREQLRWIIAGTPQKRAVSAIRLRAWRDLPLFKQKSMELCQKGILSLLSEEQIAKYNDFCIVPKHPDKQMDIDNAVVITKAQRVCVVNAWKNAFSPSEYERMLELVLSY